MGSFSADVRHAFRQLRRSPSFTVAAVAALALGIGVNTAIFSVVNRILIEPVPFPDPGRIVFFMSTSGQGSGAGASPAKFAHWSRQTEVVEDPAAFRTGILNLTDGDAAERLKSGQ